MQRIAFADLPASAFPFTIDFFRHTDPPEAAPVHRIHVLAPGPVRIPPIERWIQVKVWVRVTCADGQIIEDGR